MEAQLLILDAVTTLAGIDTIGQLSCDGGCSAQIAPSRTDTIFLDRSSLQVLSILVFGKGKDQQLVLNNLFSICNTLSKLTAYPTDTGWKVTSIEVATPPSPVGKQEDGQWIFSCILDVHFYLD